MTATLPLPALAALWAPVPRLSIPDWAAANVDFSLEPSYETPLHVPWDNAFAPYWREPAEALTSMDVREVVIWKPSRAACTESVALNALRYHMAVDPMPVLYLGSQQEPVEAFFADRIVLGLRCARPLRGKAVKVVGTRATLGGCTIYASYPGSRSVDKQSGYQLVVIDEASLCPPGTVATLRKRLDTYRYGHLLVISSMDARQHVPSQEDAIFLEWDTGDKREWHVSDGKSEFVLKMGGKDDNWGLKWDKGAKDKDGEWDLARVGETAHFLTPSGKVWDTAAKNRAVRAGRWLPTNDKPVDPRKRSYRLDALNLPFVNGDLGHYAVEWLKACRLGQEALRVFSYESKAEAWHGRQVVNDEPVVTARCGAYTRGWLHSTTAAYASLCRGRRAVVVMTVDVQADGFWWACREWIDGGDSGLVDWGMVSSWEGLKEQQVKYAAIKVFFDNSYNARKDEVAEQCAAGLFRGVGVLCYGREQLKETFDVKERDPFEGTARAGRVKLPVVIHNPNVLKSHLSRLLNSAEQHEWRLPSDVDSVYLSHMTAEVCRDGAWVEVRKANHLWDAEVLSLLAALCLGLYRHVPLMSVPTQPAAQPAGQPSQQPTPALPARPPPAGRPGRPLATYD